MTALDRRICVYRFFCLLSPLPLLFIAESRSIALTIGLAILGATYNGIALSIARRPIAWRLPVPPALLLLALDHLLVSGWVLLFAGSSSLAFLLYAPVAAEAVFRFDLWGGIGTSIYFVVGLVLFQ